MEKPKREGYSFDVRDTSPFYNYGKGNFEEIKVKKGGGGESSAKPMVFDVLSIGEAGNTSTEGKEVFLFDIPFGVSNATPINTSAQESDIEKIVTDFNNGIFDEVYFRHLKKDETYFIGHAQIVSSFVGSIRDGKYTYLPIYEIKSGDTFCTYLLPFDVVCLAWNEAKFYDPAFPVCRPDTSSGVFMFDNLAMVASAPIIEAQVQDDCEYSRITINFVHPEFGGEMHYFLHRHKTYSHGSSTYESHLYLQIDGVDAMPLSLGLESRLDEIIVDFNRKTIRRLPLEVGETRTISE